MVDYDDAATAFAEGQYDAAIRLSAITKNDGSDTTWRIDRTEILRQKHIDRLLIALLYKDLGLDIDDYEGFRGIADANDGATSGVKIDAHAKQASEIKNAASKTPMKFQNKIAQQLARIIELRLQAFVARYGYQHKETEGWFADGYTISNLVIYSTFKERKQVFLVVNRSLSDQTLIRDGKLDSQNDAAIQLSAPRYPRKVREFLKKLLPELLLNALRFFRDKSSARSLFVKKVGVEGVMLQEDELVPWVLNSVLEHHFNSFSLTGDMKHQNNL